MELHLYDIFMLVVLAAATVFGFWKGMAWQVTSVASLLVSYVVALRFSPLLAPHLGAEEPWNRFLAMLILYLVCGAVIWIGFRAVHTFIERVKLKEFDHQVGGLIGFAKGLIICLAITFFTVALSAKGRETILKTRSGYVAAVVMDKAHAVMPRELHDVLEPYIHQLDEAAEGELEYADHGHDHSWDDEHSLDRIKDEAERWGDTADEFGDDVSRRLKENDPEKTLDRLFRR